MKLFKSTSIASNLLIFFIPTAVIIAIAGYLCSTLLSGRAYAAVLILAALIGICTYILNEFIKNSITKPLRESIDSLGKMAVNDYTHEINYESSGEMGELTANIKDVRKRFLSVQDAFIRLSKGDLSRLEEFERVHQRSENDRLIPALISIHVALRNLINDVDLLLKASSNGDLSLRGDESKYEGEYIKIIKGFNKTFDTISLPLKEANTILEKMSNNDITVKMSGDYKGLFKDLTDRINMVHDRLLSIQDSFIQVSKGNTGRLAELKQVKKRSDNDRLMPSMIDMMESVNDLIKEVGKLSEAARNGDLDTRADSSKFQGGYKEIIDGLNNTIDSFSKPIHEANSILTKFSVNDFSQEITGQYNGILKEFGDKINMVRTRLLSVQDIAERVSKGDNSRLEEFNKLGRRSENDRLVPSFKNMMQTIQNLINETNLLSDAAINGNLNVRGNPDKFEGRYKDVISGLNKTLDAVVTPIHEALNVLTEMSKDNLTMTMEGSYKGDYHKLKEAVNHLLDSFNSVLGDIHISSRQVSQGSKQIAQSSQALSEGSTRQASSIEELSASIEEISVQTGRNAENANKANELAEKTKEKAVQGNSQMKEMLKAMDEINDASSNISKIIKVIDEIAFQTNILALNAAVEAARAGQHGKGFAVVAEEVRNLAARSADAAKETTSMIEGSIKKSEGGARIAKDTANALSAIMEEVSKVASFVNDIALASSEQASGIAQINQGITQVSQVVQVNSATSEESAAASEELSGQAETLNEIVGRFKLKKSVNRNSNIHEEIYSLMDNINTQGDHHKVKTGADEQRQIILNENSFGKY